MISEVDMGKPILVSRRLVLRRHSTCLIVEKVEEIPFIKGIDEAIEKLEQRIHVKEHEIIVSATCMVADEIRKRHSDDLS